MEHLRKLQKSRKYNARGEIGKSDDKQTWVFLFAW